MTALTRLLSAAAIVLLAALAITRWKLVGAQNTVTQQAATLSQQKDTLLAQSSAIYALQDSARRNEQAQIELRARLTAAGRLAANRDKQLTKLLNENETLRRWFGADLPDDIKRLHQRPAFDGPDDYLRWLSESGELRDTGQPTGNQRGFERR